MAGGRPPTREKKKLVAVRVDLLSRVIEIANREGKTVYGLTNEAFEQAIRAYEMKLTLPEILDSFSLLKMERETGAVITSGDILAYLIDRLYHTEREKLQEIWRNAGAWYGKYLLAKFHDQDPIEMLRRLLAACAWDLTDVHLSREVDLVKLRCVAPYLPMENTDLLSKYLEGVMQSLGYEPSKNDTMRGIILLEFKKRS